MRTRKILHLLSVDVINTFEVGQYFVSNIERTSEERILAEVLNDFEQDLCAKNPPLKVQKSMKTSHQELL